MCSQFTISEKLYGRETEIKTLLEAFNRVAGIENNSTKGSELMLVAGFSGVGKTAVVNEIHKPIVKQRGYFIKGKFDQFNRNIPFSAFVQAFRNLMGQLLSESDTQLSNWKRNILEALGNSAQVIIDVIPELEQIIGKQAPAVELSGTAAQNRFNLLFQKFIQVFTTKEHPLVIFLDDLQWADAASLKLMQLLMGESQTGYLLTIGAYRDNEVSSSHPLMLMLDDVSKTGAVINQITLKPLSKASLTQLVADTLSCSTQIAQPLTDIIHQKTQGNPFFATQFLKALHQDGLIYFDTAQSSTHLSSWQCDITKVRDSTLTSDVVELMTTQLQKLPTATQDILKLAACIGNKFDLSTLAIVSEKSEADAANALWKALQEGLILPQSEVYKFFVNDDEQSVDTSNFTHEIENVGYRFLHDRVQQAAYSLIPEEQKQRTHYHIGQLLLQKIPLEAREDSIFELVNQLNYGTTLISEQTERDELAQLNLIAARRARVATAYQAGREYANTGLSLLGENAWQRQYEMSLEFHENGAELASLSGDFEAMEQFIETVIAHANSFLEKVNVYRIRIQSNVSQNKFTEAITIAQQLLQNLGVTFPEAATPEDIQQAIAEISEAIGEREIEDLANLPIMTDGEKIAIVQIASSIIPAAYMSGSSLFPLLIALSVKLSIQYGNTEASALAYVTYGIIACNMMQDVDAGVKFGQLALEVVSQLDAKAVKPNIVNVLGNFILHRKSHIRDTLPLIQEGYVAALEVGNLEFVGYIAHCFCLNSFWCSQPLGSLEQETRTYCNALVQLNQVTTANYCRIYWQPILNLLGIGEHPSVLSGEALQEVEFLPRLLEAHDLYGLYVFYSYKLMLCYLFGDIESAQNHAVEVRRYLITSPGLIVEPAFYFYDSLIAIAALNSQSPEIADTLQQVEQNQTQLQQWAKYAPMNHQHKVDLVEAEKCRVLEGQAQAIELYEKAISGAKANGYTQEEALANELVAKFYLDWGKEKAAIGYMQEAYYCYARWGAKAKIDDLEKRYPQLLTPILQTPKHDFQINETYIQSVDKSSLINQTIQTHSSRSISQALDFACIVKASQALSGEIQLEELIAKLMQVVMENAGAKKAALLLLKDDTLMLEALATISGGVKLLNLPCSDSKDIPNTIVNYTKRTLKKVILDDATAQNDFIADSYIMQQQPKSLLCMPILNQGKFIGLLYLENKLTIGAFTRSRVDILNLLTAQAAISLENAQLYGKLEGYSHTLEQKVEERTLLLTEKATQLELTLQELQFTQAQLIQAEKMSGLGQLVAGIAHEINNPISFIYGNLTPANDYVESLIELINLYQKFYPQSPPEIEDKLADMDFDFLIADLPKILDSMNVGAQRIREIVLSLRNFSRLDESEMKPVDIHSGIDSTLLMLQHQLTSNDIYPPIEVIKEYGKLPKVSCYASELNQVFINIIGNAIDALRQKPKNSEKEDKPKISIHTSLKNDRNVLITIADNGIGISKSVLNKIFDPFFTTKPVGSGTGLGLSTSYSIVVKKHGGKLSCRTTDSQETEFLIELPLKS
ncbi:MAG: AAA family ATPase [Rivularia sp. (in: cyanobacteria)]